MKQHKIYDLSIVMVGEINPVIFQPSWLANKELIQETEGEKAKIDIIHNEISKFDLSWASIEVTRQRFVIRTSKEAFFETAKDLAYSIFALLKETPLKHIGINHIFHYELNDEEYVKIGDKLAPFSNWNNILKDPRLIKIEMTENERNDSFQGHYRVRVTPSELIKNNGVSISINDHFNVVTKLSRSKEAIKILSQAWENSLKRAKKTQTELWKNLNM